MVNSYVQDSLIAINHLTGPEHTFGLRSAMISMLDLSADDLRFQFIHDQFIADNEPVAFGELVAELFNSIGDNAVVPSTTLLNDEMKFLRSTTQAFQDLFSSKKSLMISENEAYQL